MRGRYVVQIALALALFPINPRRTRAGSRIDMLAGLGLLAATASVLRAELVALLIPMSLQALVLGQVRLQDLVITGCATVTLALGTAVKFICNDAQKLSMSYFPP